MNIQEREKALASVKTLGNAADVVAKTIINIAGNDISTKLGASNITLASVRAVVLARLQRKLNPGTAAGTA